MENTARVANHPIHPMLIPFPVGLFISSFIFDIVYASTGDLRFYQVSYYMILAGVIGGLLAAIPGLIDYFSMRMSRDARNTATTHMILNLVIVALFVVNLFIRYDNNALAGSPRTWSLIVSIVSLLMLTYSGWLGWALIYKHGIAVSVDNAIHEMEATGQAPHDYTCRPAGQLGGERPGEHEEPG